MSLSLRDYRDMEAVVREGYILIREVAQQLEAEALAGNKASRGNALELEPIEEPDGG